MPEPPGRVAFQRDLSGSRANSDSHAVQDEASADERVDVWLDAALEDTFPASDPVVSPPAAWKIHEEPK